MKTAEISRSHDSRLQPTISTPRLIGEGSLVTLFFSIDTSPLFETCDAKEKEGICKDVLNFYLDAILTEKGKERKKELLSEFKILTPNNIDEELS